MNAPAESSVPSLSPSTTLRVAIISEGALVLVAILIGWFLERRPLAQVQWSGDGWWLGLAATVPMLVAFFLMVRFPVGPLRSMHAVIDELIVPIFRHSSIGEMLLVAMLAGFGEELLFRGAIQNGLEQFSGRPWVAIAIASLLFGLAHPITPLYVIAAGTLGVYLGWLWIASGNLLVPIIAHAAYDFVALVYILRFLALKDSQPLAGETIDTSKDSG